MATIDSIKDELLELFRDRFGGDETVREVRVGEDIDGEGDEILRVKVILSGPGKRVDVKTRVRTKFEAWHKLVDELGETRFPVFSLIHDDEAQPAAA